MTLSEPRSSIDALLQHEEFVRNLAWRLTRDSATADDLVQETWVVALRKPPVGLTKPRSWLATVVRHLASQGRRGATRRDWREKEREVRRAVPTPHEVHENRQLRSKLAESICRLREEDRDVIEMRCADGLPPREIATRTGLPVTVVYDRLKRGLAYLRKDLDEEYGDRRQWGVALLALGGLEEPAPAAPLSTLHNASWWTWPLVAGLAVITVIGLGNLSELRAALDDEGAEESLASAVNLGDTLTPSTPGSVASRREVILPPQTDAGQLVATLPSGSIQLDASWEDTSERASGVLVSCERDDTNYPGAEGFLAETAEDGTVLFRGLLPGKWRVSPSVGSARRLVVESGRTTRSELVLKRGVSVRLSVVDGHGSPAAGIEVSQSWPARPEFWHALGTTDAAGQLPMMDLDSKSWIRARSPEFGNSRAYALAFNDRHNRAIQLRLPAPSASLKVVVRDLEGAPLAGLRVGLTGGPSSGIDERGELWQQAPPEFALTGVDGEVELKCISPRARRLYVDSPGYPRVALPIEDGALVHELTLQACATLSGVVSNAEGAPIRFARVHLRGESIGLEPFDALADEQGRFTIERLPAGEHLVEALISSPEETGYSSQTLLFESGDETYWSATLGPTPVISGLALDASGRPVAQAEIRIERSVRATSFSNEDITRSRRGSSRIRTDATGAFSAPVFAEGPFVITWVESAFLPQAVDWREDVMPSEEPLVLRATQGRAAHASLLGALFDESGAALAGAEVHVHGPLLLKAIRVPVQRETGEFHLPRLNASWYRLRIWRPGAPLVELFDGARVELAPGEAHNLGDLIISGSNARLR
jgi:RNA polymerase sigma factor (sigma-70 family)